MARIMIHTYPGRLWYVKGFLIPELNRQGIKDITIWNDTKSKGNLASCMESFASCRGHPDGTWHLQDDVLPASYFAEFADDYDTVVCGFCHSGYENGIPIVGNVFPVLMWNSSFPCIYIPNGMAAECAAWFYTDARYRPQFREWISTGKNDDNFFHAFCVERYSNKLMINHAPHLVEHVDYLIGGSSINQWRGHTSRAYYFDDDEAMERLTNWLKTQ